MTLVEAIEYIRNNDAHDAALAELAEVREVLDGLIEFSDQVIEAFEITPLPAHRLCLESARALYEKLRTDK